MEHLIRPLPARPVVLGALIAVVMALLQAPPAPVTGAGVDQIAAGGSPGGAHNCALTGSGGVKCWGGNVHGGLGDGTTTDRATPVDVVGLGSSVSQVALGAARSCALTAAGGVKCWGSNRFGALGDGTSTNRSTPVDVPGLGSGVVRVAAGMGHTCALPASGLLKCWGDNSYGQLGDGTTTNRSTPTDVSGRATHPSDFDLGREHTCAVTDTTGVQCWGRNDYGQLGDGTTTDRHQPGGVCGDSECSFPLFGVEAIDTGDRHACVVIYSGDVKCWGRNQRGQLGDGTTTDRGTPVDLPGPAGGITAVAAAASHTCARLATSAVQCWGRNTAGQLGDGTTTDSTTPVNVIGLGPKTVLGDMNCDGLINSIDAAIVLQGTAGLIDSLPICASGDVNDDGVVNSIDAALILQFDAGLIAWGD